MQKIIIFGNSASGKSTLAKELSQKHQSVHLDLDTLAWLPTDPPQRAPMSESIQSIDEFMLTNQNWVIEGCYADLLSHVSKFADQVLFMNLSIEQCQQNAKNRPWEPHKYKSKAAQDANLPMLLSWIADYQTRDDEFSYNAHIELYNAFSANKKQITSNQ